MNTMTHLKTSLGLFGMLVMFAALFATQAQAACPDYLNQDVRKLRSTESVNLCEAYAGKPMLIANTASHCGYTPQFKDLEEVHQTYKDQGLVVAGFPSNDFRQEAKTEEETATICYVNYGVTFDMYTEMAVRGDDAHPLFQGLAAEQGAPRWNFTKYLVDKDGKVVATFGSSTRPTDPEVTTAIENLL